MGYATNQVKQRSESWLDHKTTLVWMGKRAFGRRGHRILAISGAALLLVSAGLFSLHAYATATVRTHAITALEAKLGRGVAIADVDIGWSAISLGGVSVDGLGTIDRVVASYELSAALGGDIELGRVDVYGVALEVERESDGSTSIDDVVAHIKGRTAQAVGGSSTARKAPTPMALHDVRLRMLDAKTATDVVLFAAHLTPDRLTRDLAIIDGAFVGRSEHKRLGPLLARNSVEVSAASSATKIAPCDLTSPGHLPTRVMSAMRLPDCLMSRSARLSSPSRPPTSRLVESILASRRYVMPS